MSNSLAEHKKQEPPKALMNMRDHGRRALLMTEWAQQREDIQKLIAKYSKEEKDLLPKIFASFHREIRNRDDLVGKDERSAWDALADALSFRFMIGGPTGHCDLVPYGNEITCQMNYRGVVKLIMEHGGVTDVTVGEKRVGDYFDFTKGTEEKLVHKPAFSNKRERAAIELVYCILTFDDGSKKYEVWTAEDVDSHKVQYSKQWNKAEKSGKKNSPWHTAWLRMAYKTLIIAASKYVPKTPILKKALGLESERDLLVDKIIDAVSVQPAAPAAPAIEQEPSLSPTLTRAAPPETEPETPSTRSSAPEDTVEPDETVQEEDLQATEWKPDEACQTRMNQFAITISEFDELGKVDKALKVALEHAESEQEHLSLKGIAEARKKDIRSSRGGRGKSRQKSLDE